MNQLLAIRVFARVVEAGSFTKAADSLEMPKTSVSKLIQELESFLRVRLLQRTTRSVTVTADGAKYYEQTARIIRDLEEIDAGFQSTLFNPRGKIHVDVGSSVATALIIPALPEFFARFPDIEIDLGVSDRHVDLISDNVDCVIRGGPLMEQSLAARFLGQASWITCATPAYLQRFGVPAHPRELENDHRVICYQSARTNRVIPAVFQRGDEKFEVIGSGVLSVNESNAHIAAGLAGLGVIHTFNYAVQPYIETEVLVPILQDWRPAPYPFHVAYPPNRNLSNRVRVFIDWLVEHFSTLK
ncbi:LysR family transcriptional regulator [Pseudomonas sp. FW306-02-F02-AA]|uniref:LysR family transcriptional regulator n=1 Tax=Pseudomonas fluorescens TaxID=294 RepID=A0A0N9WRR2_PSEFL|nr:MULTISPECIES: LysR family transcriptional regulator [Pseudomonas]ALI04817.1 LysR family transcriptional regulator [Pseudomonas fluorescens]PMZ05540.1 LysR family transcriptional regulator [Pseudomonas sp. FW306-02-F02-AB]PMZ11109.1 LysR family transcriptional regulator [Pseudomonas sp. FW306-02-H06C]PMZ17064.1 LysR family transcriptional regulator [Pseudomonas sp. FW306-02-F02-AA]PMZ23310.1 LysR family transcriptional regulator [Pseudomonas sp. FW306-02-F08-AA]